MDLSKPYNKCNILSMVKTIKQLVKAFPDHSGVYLMKNARQTVIYVGKASSLKKRVNSYLVGAHDTKTTRLVQEIAKISFQLTDSVLEATILEAELIKKYKPQYNILQKDDRSFLYIVITKEKFPKVLIKRGSDLKPPLLTSECPGISKNTNLSSRA